MVSSFRASWITRLFRPDDRILIAERFRQTYMDFGELHAHRRRMQEALRNQQKADSECVRKLRAVAGVSRKALFDAVLEELFSFTSDQLVSPNYFERFRSFTKNVDVHVWISAVNEFEETYDMLIISRAEQSAAAGKNAGISPFGSLSRAFMDEKKKNTAVDAKRTLAICQETLLSSILLHSQANEVLTNHVRLILIESLSAEGIDRILANGELQGRFRPIIDSAEIEGKNIWDLHLQSQRESVSGMLSSLEFIRSEYYTLNAGRMWK